MHAGYSSKNYTLRSRKHQLYGDIKSRYQAAMENVITFTRFWYLIKRTTNSTGILANWINCLLYKVLLNLHTFPVLNKNCTRLYLGQLHRSYIYIYIFTLIKLIVQCFECKFLERVLLIGAISICKRFSKVSNRCETKPDVRPVSPCNLYVLSIYIMTYNTRFVFKTKK